MSNGGFSYKDLKASIETSPYETLFKASKMYKDGAYDMSDDDRKYMHKVIGLCVDNISLPDEKVLLELVSLGKKMSESKDPMARYCPYVYEVVEKNPSLLDSALDFCKNLRYPEADTQLLRIATERPNDKSKIFAFLRDNICDGAENCANMVRFAYLSENEEIKSEMIKKLSACETGISGWEDWAKVASLTGDNKHCENACSALREEVFLKAAQFKGLMLTGPCSIADKMKNIASKDIKRSLSKELFYSADVAILRVPKDGYNYANLHKVAGMAISSNDDMIPDVMSALKREVRDVPSRDERSYMYSDIGFQMDTFYDVLTDVVKKRPEMAKDAFSICKDFNKVMMGDERHTYIGGGHRYYNLLEHLSEADNSLKPEITSTVRESIRRDKERVERDGDYAGEVSSSIEAGKKVMQKITAPEVSVRGNGGKCNS